MLVKQISVFVENKPGRLYDLTEVLGRNNINLVTLQIADTKEYGILRAITKDNEKAVRVLQENGFTVKVTELVGVEVDDKPGSLSEILQVFDKNKLSIEYLYSFARDNSKKAVILLRVDDAAKAEKIIIENNFKIADDSIYL